MAVAKKNNTDKRDIILKAAWSRIKHYGFDKTTVDEIAREAGIAKGTVYLYFKSKEDIMLALAERTNRNILDELRKICESKDPIPDKIRDILVYRLLRIYDIVQKYPHGEEIVSIMKPFIVERIEKFLEMQAILVKECIEEGIGNGLFKKVDPEKTAATLTDLFELLTPPYYRIKSRKHIDKFARNIMDLVLRGLLIGKDKK